MFDNVTGFDKSYEALTDPAKKLVKVNLSQSKIVCVVCASFFGEVLQDRAQSGNKNNCYLHPDPKWSKGRGFDETWHHNTLTKHFHSKDSVHTSVFLNTYGYYIIMWIIHLILSKRWKICMIFEGKIEMLRRNNNFRACGEITFLLNEIIIVRCVVWKSRAEARFFEYIFISTVYRYMYFNP